MGWQSIWIVGASACVIFILLQKIQKMAKCTFRYQLKLTRIVPHKVQRAIKWLCVCVLWNGEATFFRNESQVEVLEIIQYSALVVRSGYTGNVVVLRVVCTKW